MASESRRYLDLAIVVKVGDVTRDAKGRPRPVRGSEEELLRVGGVWDRRKKRWVPRGALKVRPRKLGRLVLRFHRGQEGAVRWICDWLKRFVANDWEGVERAWSLMLIGGRRSGKTHLCCAMLVIFAILKPRAVLWAISPTLDTGDELDTAFREMLPRAWYRRRQAKTGRSTTYLFANGDRKWRGGSRILLKSGVNPARLKAGRVDIAFLNEAQEIAWAAYMKLRAPIADKGGIVVIAANPPDKPIGRWVEKHYFRIKAREIDGVAFELNPQHNPYIEFAALASMAKEVDPDEFDRDVLGLFHPIGDRVFKHWSDGENIRDPHSQLEDITAEVSKRALGHAAAFLVGMDFQRVPAMVGIVHKVFRDPTTKEEFLWVVDEAVVDESDEQGLLDHLEAKSVWRMGDGNPDVRTHDESYRGWIVTAEDKAPAHCAVVMDATGFHQDGAHNKGQTSEKHLRARHWIHLYKPQRDSDANPSVAERMKSGRALIRSAAGSRRLFVAKHCVQTAEALRNYENKHGIPYRRSVWAHVVDGVTYVGYRLFGVPKVKGATKPEYISGGKFEDRGMGW